MRVNRRSQIAHNGSHFNSQHGFRDQFTGAGLYDSERQKAIARDFPNGFDAVRAGEVFGQHLAGLDNDHYLELSHRDRKRIFNLGYFTWVEQQGIALEDFDSRRDQSFWQGLAATLPDWDRMIEDFNGKTGVE